MVEAIIGFAVGAAAGIALKDKLMGDNNENNKLQSQLDEISFENEKYRNRNKELERQVEDLLAENKKLRAKFNESDNTKDDLEDQLAMAKSKIISLTEQNEKLAKELKQL